MTILRIEIPAQDSIKHGWKMCEAVTIIASVYAYEEYLERCRWALFCPIASPVYEMINFEKAFLVKSKLSGKLVLEVEECQRDNTEAFYYSAVLDVKSVSEVERFPDPNLV